MKRYGDDELVGRFVPTAVTPPLAEGETAACERLHCAAPELPPGSRRYRWRPRYGRGPAVELCGRCHKELATIIGGG